VKYRNYGVIIYFGGNERKEMIHMPFIQFDGPQMNKEKKAELVAKLTQTAHEVLGIPEQAFSVIIRENSMDNIGAGGKLLSETHK
jgi:4-oxalocrotonate tautomerase